MSEFRPCLLIPTYDNPATIGAVVERARSVVRDLPGAPAEVVVVDDGSAEQGRVAAAALASIPGVHVHRREKNGGKGAAVKDGFRVARDRGFTHALQVDADGQHCLEDIPRFLDAARAQPEALVLGAPRFDETAPKSRVHGRKFGIFWTTLETYGRRVIQDPMCGFRVYPLEAALAARPGGDAMDFDPEIAVRMAWAGVPVINLPTEVRYLKGGVSHFRLYRDNLLISWMHTRLVFAALVRLVLPKWV